MSTTNLGRRLFRSGGWALGGRLLGGLTGFAVNAVISRLIEPADVGIYFLVVSIVMAGVAFGQAGLQLAVVRLIAEAGGLAHHGRARAIPGMATFLAAITGGVVALAVLGLGAGVTEGLFDSPRMSEMLWYIAAWIWMLSCSSVIAESLRGFHAYGPATVLGGLLASCLVLAALVALGGALAAVSLEAVLAVSIAAVMVNGAIGLHLLFRQTRLIQAKVKIHARELLGVGWPLMITGAAVFILTQADLWIVGAMGSKEEVAVYGAATRLCQFVYIPLLIGNVMLPPFIAEMFAQGRLRELERIIRLMATLSAGCALVPLFIILAAAGDVLRLVYGEYYASGGNVLAILSLGQIVNVLTGSAMFTLMMTGHQKDAMAITLGFGAGMIALAILSADRFGVEGVAAAVSAFTAASALFTLFWVRRKTGLWTHVGWTDPRQLYRHIRAGLASR